MANVALETRSFGDGEKIFGEGETGNEAYLITKGYVAVSRQEDGETVALGTRAEGEIVGEMALIDEAPRSATVTAEGEVEAQVLTKEAVEQMLAGTPETLQIMLRQLLESLRCANDLIAMYACRPTG